MCVCVCVEGWWRSLTVFAGSNSAGGVSLSLSLSRVCYTLLGRGLCDVLITHQEDSYLLYVRLCVHVCR